MNIVQITPGAGGMYCGNCFRDNALVAAFRQSGHDTLMVPLYLPMTLDEENQSAGTPIFFSGINVYLENKSAFFRNAPDWLHRLLAAPALLKWASGRAARTRAEDVGDLTLSMLRGEEGKQARELNELIGWLKQRPKPDVICLSNALLIGMVRRLRSELGVPVVCMLQGEAPFLDALPEGSRTEAWRILAERAAETDLFIAPSRYFGELMTRRLGLSEDRLRIVANGINLAGYAVAPHPPNPPVLGFFSRMCREKGVDRLVETFIVLKKRGRVPMLRLRVGGGLGPADEGLVQSLREQLISVGLDRDAEFVPNLDREGKLAFFQSLSVMCVPALYGEAFGLYLLEALASGVPVVQPRHGAFPEIVGATGGGLICEPDPVALAEGIERILVDPIQANTYREAGRLAVQERFSVQRMGHDVLAAYREAIDRFPSGTPLESRQVASY